jgi:leader peptidase (prepilin peptidase)/N-methyltransferase
MGADSIFNPAVWAGVPFHFWTGVFFVFGCVIGSFLNVCIHRMPLEMSIVSPPSHCPHCKYAIPFYLNIPLVTWISLRGRCKNWGSDCVPVLSGGIADGPGVCGLLAGVWPAGPAAGRPGHRPGLRGFSGRIAGGVVHRF